MQKYIAVDVGGTAIKYGLVDVQGAILDDHEKSTQATLGGNRILEKVLSIIGNYKDQEGVAGVGISTAGMVNVQTGEIFYASPLIPGYMGINYKQAVEETFNLKCEVENDVYCAGLAESTFGVAKDVQSAVVLTIGTGIGGCLINSGRIYRGFSNSACAFGYMLVDGKAWESQAAASVLVKKVTERKGTVPGVWDGKAIFQAASAGDIICIQEIDNMVEILAKGIANICYAFNPEVVVLGGGIMAQTEYLRPRINAALDLYLIPSIRKHTRLEFAKMQNHAGMLGAFVNFTKMHPACQ